jgi:adenine-specific DNA-methyltransferase
MTLEALVLRLHDQLARGASEEEFEATRTLLDDEWTQMGERERRLYAGLLHDLKSLRGRNVVLEAVRAGDEHTQILEAQRLAASTEWEQSLRVLRGVVPARLKPDVARLRAQSWGALGFATIAERFAEFAGRGVPSYTPFHAKYWAHSLRLARHDGVDALSRSIGNARVDLNPHQIDAALFALRSPYSKGVLLADEVGLGKTIEASLILAQKWAERRRHILLIVPATLRKQWQSELEDKFFLPSIILEARAASVLIKQGLENPFSIENKIVICSYQFVFAKRALVQQVNWDLVVVDEAHRLRSVYKETKTAVGIVDAIRRARKILLTATPLQNSLLELYGLVGIIDPEIFGSQEAFQAQFLSTSDVEQRDAALRARLQHVCKRTLRRQVLEYVPFTNRFTHTADFVPSRTEELLYEEVSAYLQRESLVALPNARRKLITLILRKLLASSSAAIGATLAKFAERLSSHPKTPHDVEVSLAQDFESLEEIDEELANDGADAPEPDTSEPDFLAKSELEDLQRFVKLAQSVEHDAKATKLVEVLPRIFELAQEKGAARKAVIFTESVKTQEYLFELLSGSGHEGDIVLMNGSNNDETSRRIYAAWKKRNEHRWEDVSSGSKTADMKAAIVDEFREHSTLMIATESAAEGVNLQFCSVVVNYDLPWNPQRIEQRIGRCHRYGQKTDVLVVNFLNRKNEADRRVFELLDQKFNLFKGVFGASDDVLGAVESGVDLEMRIAAIYQDCRTPEQIKTAFDALQFELDDKIKVGLDSARRAFLENFDAEVHERLRVHQDAAKQSLGEQQRMLLDLAKFGLDGRATFDECEPRFQLQSEGESDPPRFHLEWQRAEALGDAFFRVDHPLAQDLIEKAASNSTSAAEVVFDYQSHASALERFRGTSGWLEVSKFTAEAVGRSEEFLLVAACDAEGTHVAPDVATKLFSLQGRLTDAAIGSAPSVLAEIRDELRGFHLQELQERNEEFFDEEVDKLERWAEDVKFALERELRELDMQIKAAKKTSKSAVALAEKLEAQKLIKTIEAKRNTKRRQLFEAQDDVDRKRADLIEEIEHQLKAKTNIEPIFTLRWTLGDGARGTA